MSAERNYLQEAVAIASGESRLLAEPGHITALAGQMESVLADSRRLSEMLAAVMVDTGQTQFVLPEDLLTHVREQGLEIVIESTARFVRVRMFRRPVGATSGTVN